MDFKNNELKFVDNEIKQRMLRLDEQEVFCFGMILQHYGVDEETLKMTKETSENVKLLHLSWSMAKIKQGLRKQFFHQFRRIA